MEEGFRTRFFETSGNEGVSIIEACLIKEGHKECVAYGVEEITTGNDIEVKVTKDDSTEDGNTEHSFPVIRDTSTVASESQRETKETKGGEEETKVDIDAYDEEIAEKVAMGKTIEDGNTEDSNPLIPDTLVTVSESQCETEETKGSVIIWQDSNP